MIPATPVDREVVNHQMASANGRYAIRRHSSSRLRPRPTGSVRRRNLEPKPWGGHGIAASFPARRPAPVRRQ